MKKRVFIRILTAAMLACPLVLPTVQAGPNSFRYVDQSERLPPDTNQPGTDALDVDFVDVDGDGDLDIFVANGTASPAGRPNKLYINDGSGHFSDETTSRLPGGPAASSAEVEFADVDSDGDLDAIVANVGPEQLLLNNGQGVFTDASSTHLPPPLTNIFDDISIEARFVDVDRDGDQDILIANENPFPPAIGAQNRLLINDGSGHFSDQTATRLPARIDQTEGFAIGDIDRDGDPDLIVVNIGQDFVFINDGTGRFSDQTSNRFPATLDSTRKGVLADFNRDGSLDLFMGNSRNEQSRLYFNNGHGVFTDATADNVPAALHTSTDVEVADLDTDGDLDLYLVNAGVFEVGHGFVGEQNVYLRNNKHGKFIDTTKVHFPQVADPSTDAAFGDVDDDGDLDLLIGNAGSVGFNGKLTLYIRQRCAGAGQNCQ